MSNSSIFTFGNYAAKVADTPVDQGNGAYGNYVVENTETGVTELYFSTYLQAASACVELSQGEEELSKYVSSLVEEGEYEERAPSTH